MSGNSFPALDLNESRRLLHRLNLRPSQRLGQNFLVDPAVAGVIAAEVRAPESGLVVEVGGGLGALTDHLLDSARRVLGIERDPVLARHLRERFAGYESVEIIEADAAAWDRRGLFAKGGAVLIGNLPYSAGGAIMRNFLSDPSPVSSAVLMLQKEVADRLLAEPRTKSYGALTLRIGQRWQIENLRILGPDPFHPRPQIDSAVIRLTPRPDGSLPAFHRGLFDRLVTAGFSQRRKQLRKLLPPGPISWPELTEKLDRPPTVRAEELGLRDWVELTRVYGGLTTADQGQSDAELFDVVDENDRVTGQAPRAQVHAEGLRHRAVHILLFNRAGEIYLQRRSHLKDTCPGLWDSSAAGHLDAGEDYLQSAERELTEELGLEGVELKNIAHIDACEDTGWEFVGLYSGMVGRRKIDPEPREIDSGGFFPMPLVREWIEKRPQDFAPGFLRCLESIPGD